MKSFLKHIFKITIFYAMGIVLVLQTVQAQTLGNTDVVSEPFESQYFFNRYIGNPAMAGIDSSLNLNVAYRKQFQGLPGAPVTQAFTADYNPGKRVGLGLIAYNDKAGVINNTRLALTYAYHLPLGINAQQLHFGISGIFSNRHINMKDLIGDEADPSAIDFNNHKNSFDIDYGMGYTDEHITLQAALSNLIEFFQNTNKAISNFDLLYLAAAYKFKFTEDGINSVEPQISLRSIKGYKNIVDIGANICLFHNVLDVYGLYHSSGNFSVGAGVGYKRFIFVRGAYLTSTSGLREYTDGSYEVSLTVLPFH